MIGKDEEIRDVYGWWKEEHATWSGGRLQDEWWRAATWGALHSR